MDQLRATSRFDFAVFEIRDLGDSARHVQTHDSHSQSPFPSEKGSRWANTTPTDSRAQRNRAGRRGGQLLTRARSSSFDYRPAHVTCSPVPLSRMVAPYANTPAGTTGTGDIMPVTNRLERLNGAGRRRTKVIPRFPTERSCLTLLYASLVTASKLWRGIPITAATLRQLAQLRAATAPAVKEEAVA